MDVKIAVISGVAFAGVLVAGAIAAPRGGGDDDSRVEPTGVITTDVNGNFVYEPAARWSDDDDDDRYEDDDDDDDRYEHDDDDDDDDDDRYEHDDDDDDDDEDDD